MKASHAKWNECNYNLLEYEKDVRFKLEKERKLLERNNPGSFNKFLKLNNNKKTYTV